MEEVNTKEGNTETVAMETEATTDAHEIDPRSPSPQESVPATATGIETLYLQSVFI